SETLNWVLGFYVFGKVSGLARLSGFRPLGLGRSLDARLAARARSAGPAQPPADEALPVEQRKIKEVLGLGADALGAICLIDVLREGIFPPYQSCIDIHFAYRAVLLAYVGTNKWSKWTDKKPDAPDHSWAWLAAWLAALILVRGVEFISADNLVVMPGHLTGTLLWVFAIYGLGWTADLARKGGLGGLGLDLGQGQAPEKPAAPVEIPHRRFPGKGRGGDA
ncbi:MAG: hypothetical protein PHU21_15130, partial [Elusimicrobia bacterium]|nr:hypothetical protein [Elusimicrobiota bacterium]